MDAGESPWRGWDPGPHDGLMSCTVITGTVACDDCCCLPYACAGRLRRQRSHGSLRQWRQPCAPGLLGNAAQHLERWTGVKITSQLDARRPCQQLHLDSFCNNDRVLLLLLHWPPAGVLIPHLGLQGWNLGLRFTLRTENSVTKPKRLCLEAG